MKKVVVAIIILIVALGAVLLFVLTNNDNTQEDAANPETPGTTTSNPPVNTPIDEGNTGQEPGGTEETTNEITMDNMTFSPEVTRVRKGTTVTWTNNDTDSHTVTGVDGGPDSPIIAPGETYSFTFSEAGTFDYICTLHPGMEGTIVVAE